MAEESFLSDEFIRQLTAVGEVDILVGVPTLNNRGTIEQVLKAVQVGLVKYFPRERTALINPDGGSNDGTLEVVKNASLRDFGNLLTSTPLRTTHRITEPYRAIDGEGSALRIVLAAADLLRAKACAIIYPDLESITPEWIEGLVRPIYREKFDLVTPIYHRHKSDGLLIRNIIAPMIRALYGVRVREPVGAELAMSGPLACHYLEQDIWHGDLVHADAEVWLTTSAVVDGFRLCQSFLGPKVHAARPGSQDIVGAIKSVVGSLFRCMEAQDSYWLSRSEPQPVPVFGLEYSSGLEPRRLNKNKMFTMFQNGVQQLGSLLEPILSPETWEGIQKISQGDDKAFRFPEELWVKTIYEFAASFHHSVINRDHLLQALTPLYRGRICSVLLEEQRFDAEQIEKNAEDLCQQYEKLKPYLMERWTQKV